MREIKFRAWDKIDKKMRVVTRMTFGLPATGHCAFLVHLDDGTDNPVTRSIEDISLIEFTGLKDKNGKEIYEEDIVRFGDTAHEKGCYCDHCWPECPVGTMAIVIWLSAGFQVIPLSAYPEQGGYCQECSSYGGLFSPNHEMEIGYFAEVIGNIYENGNLLQAVIPPDSLSKKA